MQSVFSNHTNRVLNELGHDMNVLFDAFLNPQNGSTESGGIENGNPGHGAHGNGSATQVPAMDVAESDRAYRLALDLPGIAPDRVHVDLEEGRLTVHGEARQAVETSSDDGEGSQWNWRRRERWTGGFKRVVRLPDDADGDAIDASYEHGQLTLLINKVAKAQPRRIEIRSGESSTIDAATDQ